MVKEIKEFPVAGATGTVVTVMALVAVCNPSTVVTVIVAVPGATAVTTPAVLTVAIAALLVPHVTFRLVAFAGSTVGTRAVVAPTTRLAADGATTTLVTKIAGAASTCTVLVAVCKPSAVVTIMVAVPGATPVTTPAVDTVATAGLVVFQATARLVALAGCTVANSACGTPTVTVVTAGAKVTLLTGTCTAGAATTCTMLVSVCRPSTVVTIMVAVPGATPVTTPSADTWATAGLVVLQVKARLVALAGSTVANSCCGVPTVTVVTSGSKVTPVTATGFTVMVLVAVKPPSAVVTVIVAVPGATAVTRPAVLTVAIAELLVPHVTFRLVAFAGSTVGTRAVVAPTTRLAADGATETLVTGTTLATLTEIVCETGVPTAVPLATVAVIVAAPAVTPVTKPLALTVATAALLVVHSTVLSVAVAGVTAAVSC